jgi:tetraacyldisaccharide 4'-kinase
LRGPVTVDPNIHRASDVGDEPLLLARAAPTVVARDRPAGAHFACASGANAIVMDDGFQNPSLAKDLSVLVVDGRRGVGNGRVIPAGPLRAPLEAQLARADALLLVGETSDAAPLASAAHTRDMALFHARLEPDREAIAALAGRRVLAFAGIADPEKFFATLRAAGIDVAAGRSFPDHHVYTAAEAAALLRDAERDGLTLATTEKDFVRLQGDALAPLAARTRVVPVTLAVAQMDDFRRLLLDAVRR